jgi:hypothetical protein
MDWLFYVYVPYGLAVLCVGAVWITKNPTCPYKTAQTVYSVFQRFPNS